MRLRAFIAALGGAASGGSLPEGVNLVCAEAALPPGLAPTMERAGHTLERCGRRGMRLPISLTSPKNARQCCNHEQQNHNEERVCCDLNEGVRNPAGPQTAMGWHHETQPLAPQQVNLRQTEFVPIIVRSWDGTATCASRRCSQSRPARRATQRNKEAPSANS